MAAKGANEDELKKVGSDATEALGPIMKQSEKAYKMAGLLIKAPNPKMAESLMSLIDDVLSGVNDLKPVLKDLKAAAK